MTTQEDVRQTGTVKFFKESAGFGFCTRKDGKDVFIHAKDLKAGQIVGGLLPGDVLEFELVSVPGKAPKAVNIKRVARETA